MILETISTIPLWVLAMAAMAIQFWLFCLLPHWINSDAEVLQEAYVSSDGDETP
jgi:hypothetical protein